MDPIYWKIILQSIILIILNIFILIVLKIVPTVFTFKLWKITLIV